MSPEHEKRFQFLSNQFCLYTFHQLMSHSAKCSSACSNMVSSSPRFSVSGVIQMQNLCLNPWTSPAGSRLVRWRQFPALWVGYQQKEDLSGWRVPWVDL